MKKLFYYGFLAISAIVLIACSPEDGKDGQQGPQGEQGLPGEDGNANVIASGWLPIVWDSDGPHIKIMVIKEERLSETYFEQGGFILAYFKSGDDSSGDYSIYSLPHIDSGTTFEYFHSKIGENSVITFKISDESGVASFYDDGNYSFQYILVPGSTTSAENALVREGIDIANYNEMAAFYGIEN